MAGLAVASRRRASPVAPEAYQLWHISYGISVMAYQSGRVLPAGLTSGAVAYGILVMAHQLWHISYGTEKSKDAEAYQLLHISDGILVMARGDERYTDGCTTHGFVGCAHPDHN